MKTCPLCKSNNVIIFDADNDLCNDCNKWFPAVADELQTAAALRSAEFTGSVAGRVFTVGDLWGPFACEAEGCKDGDVYSILLTEEENASLPEQHGPVAVRYIFDKKLGTALCEKHIKAARQ